MYAYVHGDTIIKITTWRLFSKQIDTLHTNTQYRQCGTAWIERL